jgi:AraC-like DNA-binding protein
LQPSLDFHFNAMLTPEVVLVRLPSGREASFGWIYRGLSSDVIRRIADRDPVEATNVLKQQLAGKPCMPALLENRSDRLAADPRAGPNLQLVRWARSNRVTREYIWRSFHRRYGVSPVQFRSEIKARRAWLALTGSGKPVSRLAADFGFSDQAHMARAVKALTGTPPAQWRNQVRSALAGC